MTKTRQWAIFTAIAVLIVFAGGYKLLVSPQRSNASNLNAQAATEQASSSTLQIQLAQLEADKRNLPEQQKILESIASKIPADVDEPALIRQLQNAGSSAGVDMTTVSPSTPTAVVAAAAAPTTGTAATTATPASTLSLYQMPISISISGTYFNAEMYLHTLEGLSRAMLVTGFSITPDTTTPSDSGEAIKSADTPVTTTQVTMQVNAEVFLSPAAAPTVTTPTTATGSTAAAS